MKKLQLTEKEVKALFHITSMKSANSIEGSEKQIFFEQLTQKIWALHPSNPTNKNQNK